MKAKLGKVSAERLATCHEDLQRLVREVYDTAPFDIVVLCGHRDEKAQELAFNTGMSKLHWPHSRHNSTPSLAVDLAPYPVDWKDRAAFAELRHHVLFTATKLGIPIRVIIWDLPHYELIKQ